MLNTESLDFIVSVITIVGIAATTISVTIFDIIPKKHARSIICIHRVVVILTMNFVLSFVWKTAVFLFIKSWNTPLVHITFFAICTPITIIVNIIWMFDLRYFIIPRLVNIIGISGKIGSGKTTACQFFKSKNFIEINFADKLKDVSSTLTTQTINVFKNQKGLVFENGEEFKYNVGTMRKIIRLYLQQVYSSPRILFWLYQFNINNVIESFTNHEKVCYDTVLHRLTPLLYYEILPDKTKLKSNGISVGKILQILGLSFRNEFDSKVWMRFVWNDIIQGVLYKGEWDYVIGDMRMENEACGFDDYATLIRLERSEEKRSKFIGGRDPNHKTETDLDDYDFGDCVIENNGTEEEFFKKLEKIQI